MLTLSLTNLINDYKDVLSSETISELKLLRQRQEPFKLLAKKLKAILFDEEWDMVCDSISESDDRKRGINPMNEEYIERVRQKREAFGVTNLNSAGLSVDDSATKFCEEVIRKSKNYSEKAERIFLHQKDIVYVDMDNVLVDFQSGIDAITEDEREKYRGRLDEVPEIFSLMKPNKDAVKSFKWLTEHFEVYILTTAPWENPSAWSDKLMWVKKHLGDSAKKRLILSHHKNLLKGEFIIDDRTNNGVDKFDGKHIHFGSTNFENWEKVISYLKQF